MFANVVYAFQAHNMIPTPRSLILESCVQYIHYHLDVLFPITFLDLTMLRVVFPLLKLPIVAATKSRCWTLKKLKACGKSVRYVARRSITVAYSQCGWGSSYHIRLHVRSWILQLQLCALVSPRMKLVGFSGGWESVCAWDKCMKADMSRDI